MSALQGEKQNLPIRPHSNRPLSNKWTPVLRIPLNMHNAIQLHNRLRQLRQQRNTKPAQRHTLHGNLAIKVNKLGEQPVATAGWDLWKCHHAQQGHGSCARRHFTSPQPCALPGDYFPIQKRAQRERKLFLRWSGMKVAFIRV